MNYRKLTYKNIRFFTRYYKLVAFAVLVTVTIIVGSLVVGDSVRSTLVKRVTERLGDTETIIFSRNSFMEERMPGTLSGSARRILLSNGFISRNGKLVPVFVWGVDDMSIGRGSALINEALAAELEQNGTDDIVLRLPASGLVPSGSLFVTENYTTSLRLSYGGIADAEDGGNISMKNEQMIPFNIFVNQTELAEVMELEGKINLILTSKQLTTEDLDEMWDYSLSGLSVSRKDAFTEITSDRVFIQDEITETVCRNNRNPNRLFSYLVNSIGKGGTSVPYSFVTAADRYKDEVIRKDGVILSDYSARRLQAKTGDTVMLAYFVSRDMKTLTTDTIRLQVQKIVPLSELHDDRTLSADFPGLSDVERCTDWDSDLPVNMDLITGEDEDYWKLYRSTPKAIIAYDAVSAGWSNAYGNATAIRIDDPIPDLSGLTPEMSGIQLIHPREAGLYAARNGVDFSSLFMALAFFIIISAILLMLVPLSEMLYQRRHEITLLKALGYSRKRIIRLFWMESAPVVLISSVAGVITGLLYTGLIMWLLGNVWKGATHTGGFSVYPGTLTVIAGFVAGVGLSLWLLRMVISRSLKEKPYHNSGRGKPSLKRKRILAVFSGIITILLMITNLFLLYSVTLFVLAGVVLIGTAALWGDYLVCLNGPARHGGFDLKKQVWSTLHANRKQSMLSFFTLATGVFIVFSVGLNRKGFADSSGIRTGTGGFSLWCESSVPVYHNMATQAGREKLSLTGLPANTKVIQCLRYGADDASCLNLNKVSTPTVLGVDMDLLSGSDFGIEQSLYQTGREDVFERMQVCTDSVYPALVDATVLIWSLGMNLGDTLHYTDDKGKDVSILLAGTLSNSIFQGHILIDRRLFSGIWGETTGSEVFLLKVDEPEKEEVKMLLSQALNEYGVRVTTTNDRLRQFNTVTDTYLTIFLTLGGLGLLLGIMGFIIVIRKNLAMRRNEIILYRMLGFSGKRIEQVLYRENLLVPLYAIVTGVIGSLVGVSISFMNTGVLIWLLALLFTVFFIVCVFIFVGKSVKNEVEHSTLST